MLTLAITSGEPAGIGPELVAAALHWPRPADVSLALIGDESLFPGQLPRHVRRLPIPLAASAVAGQLDKRNGLYVLATLDRATAGALSGEFDAMLTPPVHKGIINDAGVAFTGHTEYLAARCGVEQVVMMLVGGHLRVALATTHLPLSAVSAAITPHLLDRVLDVLVKDLRLRFALPQPRIAVTGLNPHAGEGGHLGHEERDVIEPALARAKTRGIDVHGPYPADTLFVPKLAQQFDAILAMYHDQGLAPLKQASFGHGVNVTLGLPFVRTSVDHGTALDLAGKGKADVSSMRAAFDLALALMQHSPRAGRIAASA